MQILLEDRHFINHKNKVMAELKNNKLYWPDSVRLEMIDKSNFYQEPRIYQYGYYDGFQKCLVDSKSREMIEMLQRCKQELINYKFSFGQGSELEYEIGKLINEITDL